MAEINVPELFRLWNSTASNTEICLHFGITTGSLWSLRKRYGLPVRPRAAHDDCQRRPDDPTPEEIAERAAECRARRSAQEQARMSRAGRVGWEMPAYTYDGRDCAFIGVAN